MENGMRDEARRTEADAITARWERIYGELAGQPSPLAERLAAARQRVQQLVEQQAAQSSPPHVREVDQSSVMLITYADQVSHGDQGALTALEQFLDDVGLVDSLTHIHFLPFFPYSSDDGFSVIDFRQLDAVHGTWDDVRRLATKYGLMFDLVLNHVSAQSGWFQDYLQGSPPFDEFFIEVDPQTDLSQVTRPRSLPLLTSFETSRGERHLWTTFSADQVDLNYANPAVLAEMIDVLLFFVSQGAQFIRLDAIAYLWKQLGTSCIHLPQTHEVVRLLRDVTEQVAPYVRLITETNVPHAENVSYFGDGDEAHLVYQFSLPPLLLEAMLSEDATALQAWMRHLAPPPPGCLFFNFTASHDGIGVRPLEGLVSSDRFDRLVAAIRARGGKVGMKRNADGTESPYELNITYLSALAESETDPWRVPRFLTTQAIMLALQGLPAVYFHSLVGTPNDIEAVAASGIPRRINRRKYQRTELDARLADPDGAPRQVLDGMQQLFQVRAAQAAFHPECGQQVIDSPDPRVLLFRRGPTADERSIIVAANFSGAEVTVQPEGCEGPERTDLLSDLRWQPGQPLTLGPYQCAWLR